MVAGFNMLSFDLFGIGRRAPMQPERAETEFQNPKSPKPDNEPDQHDKDQEYELFFWSLYPVI
ncbi:MULTISPECIES: hypothetical protein [Rhizobium/Agrobacterium group]|uniref:hypothetical protein n=1 Tax=Rhizobium/Agrobacterium group TaxID=227290 RepID=UPI00110E05A0|nr:MULTISPECIES: hypothetical protein [Rhizobium/Agrobacterium group]NWJ23624.1 hypothetical protein [Rhizobium sp. RM]TMV19456.1 hypothetical protein BJG94_12775 [Rhizobium sp. Td3]UXS05048.1 hypothetical protein FY156_26810 [Agrobacterium tumefaciens]